MGFALGFLASLLEGFSQTQMLAVASHWPPAGSQGHHSVLHSPEPLMPVPQKLDDLNSITMICPGVSQPNSLSHMLDVSPSLPLFIVGSVCPVFNSNKSKCFSVLITRIRVAQHEQTCILAKPAAPTVRTLLLFPNLRLLLSLYLPMSPQLGSLVSEERCSLRLLSGTISLDACFLYYFFLFEAKIHA